MILGPLLVLGVLVWLWWARRGSGLTRLCRWRQVPDGWRCSACGATGGPGGAPRVCGRKSAPNGPPPP